MSPEKKLYSAETWKLKKTLFERYQNNTAIGGGLPHLKIIFLYSISFHNVPPLFVKILAAGGQTPPPFYVICVDGYLLDGHRQTIQCLMNKSLFF